MAKRKVSNKAVSVPAGIAIGALTALAVTMIGAMLLAFLVMKEIISMDGTGFSAMIVVTLASAAGAWLAAAVTKSNKLLVCSLTAVSFFVILLSITAVFFDGVFHGVGLTALMILLGAGVNLLPFRHKKSVKSKIKIPAYR
jgi:putative membrane protein (TIGR04086 family)